MGVRKIKNAYPGPSKDSTVKMIKTL